LVGDFYFVQPANGRTKLAAVQTAPTKPSGRTRQLA